MQPLYAVLTMMYMDGNKEVRLHPATWVFYLADAVSKMNLPVYRDYCEKKKNGDGLLGVHMPRLFLSVTDAGPPFTTQDNMNGSFKNNNTYPWLKEKEDICLTSCPVHKNQG